MSTRSYADWVGLAGLVLMWGTAFAVIRLAVDSVAPLGVAAGRIVVAAAVLSAAVWVAGLRFPRSVRAWSWFVVLGIVGNALPFYLIGWGQERIASGVTGILMAMNPLVTLFLAHFFVRGETLTPSRLAGFALGFAGVVVLIGPAAVWQVGGDVVRQGAVLCGSICYAANSVLARRMPETHPLVASACVLLAAAVAVVPLALASPLAAEASGASLLAIAWLGVVPTAAATVVYFRIVSSAGPTFLSLVNYPVPVVAVATGALVYAERPGAQGLLALALILAGIALAELRRS